jgi:glycosyltransferase involved in cell wall biosynthesis
MAAQILQIDLAQPLPTIRAARRYTSLWLLVRFGPHPLGWVRCPVKRLGHRIKPDLLAQLIAETLYLQVHDAMRLRSFEPVASKNTPMISVVICTRERPDVLERQLRSVAQLEYPNFETIVIDNAPRGDGTRKVCERFPAVRYACEPRPGLDFARNTGWQLARGEIVAYTDDDACVDPHGLTALAANYDDAQVHCVTGVTFPLELETAAQAHFEKYGGMQRGFHRRVYKPGTWNTFFPLGSGRFGAGVNLSVRRATLEKMAGFDVALDTGTLARGGGDLDVMARVLRDGGKLVYEPRAICWHQHRRTMQQLRRQMFDYGVGFCAYSMKHAADLELGNMSLKMLKSWAGYWWWRRLKESVRLAVQGRYHFPIHLILLEALGTVSGLTAYRRSVRRARQIQAKFESPMKAAA